MKKIIILSVFMIGALACDKIEHPLENEKGFLNPETTNRVILIEEFTGAKCNNCPAAAQKIRDYMAMAPNNIVTIAIHSSNFAVPDPEHPYDFRTSAGTEIYNLFKPAGVPSGMIDRLGYPTDIPKFTGSWDEVVSRRMAVKSPLEVSTQLEFNVATNEFELSAEILALNDIKDSANFNLSAFLIEDGIIAPQTDGSTLIEDYEHNHVLRAAFSGFAGENVNSNTMAAEKMISREYSLAKDAAWATENCSAIIYVYNRDTYEVIQAHHAELE